MTRVHTAILVQREGKIMKKNLFISIEGTDGVGKSTQIANIEKFFVEHGIDYIITREPGGTAIGEKIRDIILDNQNSEMSDMTEALLYAASRAQHVNEVIKPAVDAGKAVICDRFVDSSLAYQGYGRRLGESVAVINGFAIDGYMPDLTFIICLDPEIAISRIETDEKDRLESETMDFHRKVFQGYLELEKKYPDRIVTIDGRETVDQIRDEIYFHISKALGLE